MSVPTEIDSIGGKLAGSKAAGAGSLASAGATVVASSPTGFASAAFGLGENPAGSASLPLSDSRFSRDQRDTKVPGVRESLALRRIGRHGENLIGRLRCGGAQDYPQHGCA
jgi:hypothetical protein